MQPLPDCPQMDSSTYSNLNHKQEEGWSYTVREKFVVLPKEKKGGAFLKLHLTRSLKGWRTFWRKQHGVEFDFSLEDQGLFLRTRWEKGNTLQDQEKGPPDVRLGLWERILKHFKSMQEAQLMHGNLKPSNIFIGLHHVFFFDGGYSALLPYQPSFSPRMVMGGDTIPSPDAFQLAQIMKEDLQVFPPAVWRPRWEQFLEENHLLASDFEQSFTLYYHAPFDPMGLPLRFWKELLLALDTSGAPLPLITEEDDANGTISHYLAHTFLKKVVIHNAELLDTASQKLLEVQQGTSSIVWERHHSAKIHFAVLLKGFSLEELVFLGCMALCGAEITASHFDFFLAHKGEVEELIVSVCAQKGKPLFFSALLCEEEWLPSLIEKAVHQGLLRSRRSSLPGAWHSYEWSHPHLAAALSLMIPPGHKSRLRIFKGLGEWFAEQGEDNPPSSSSPLMVAYYFKEAGALDKAKEVLQEAQIRVNEEGSQAYIKRQLGILQAQRR